MIEEPILLNLPDSIETPRLVLRPPRQGDGPMLHEALVESINELRRFLSFLAWVSCEQTLDSAELWCRKGQANFISRQDLPFLIFEKSSQQLIGACGLHRTDWKALKTEVGFWIRTSRAGHGFISEAVNAITAFAFKTLDAQRIEIVTDEENAASRKVAMRCGFQLDATLRHEHRAPDGTLRNTCVYSLLPTRTDLPVRT